MGVQEDEGFHNVKGEDNTCPSCPYKLLTISNRILTNFSDSPRYFEVRVEEDTLKNVVPHSVATAFARSVLPVPGGPTINTPYKIKKNLVILSATY